MFKKTVLSLSLFASVMLGSSVMAQSSPQVKAEKASQEYVDTLKKKFPELDIIEINYLPQTNLYEIRARNTILPAYSNKDVTFMLMDGQIVDPQAKINVSQDRTVYLASQMFKELPFDKGITVKYGKGERQMVVFSDPRCPFCRQMDIDIHQNFTDKDNVTIHYFMTPLAIPGHEDAPEIARKVLCAADSAQAWKDWMINQKLPDNPGTCEKGKAVEETKDLFTKIGFNGTPSMIFDNGTLLSGARSTPQIREVFASKPAL